MISIDRLEEMAIEELETKLNNWKEQVELQSNFIDSLLKATNNSEWLDKTILDDEASEIIEKIELDYVQLDQLKEQLEAYKMEADEGKEINAELKAENEELTTINARLLGRLEVDETDTSLVFNLDKELRQKEKEFYTSIQKVVKLKQTLTEIKEIAEEQQSWNELNSKHSETESEDDIFAYNWSALKQILQKISECEVV